jgi:hypothetical protein
MDYDLPHIRDITSNVTIGRLINRLISMFDSVEDLVDEKDRRRALDLQLEEEDEEGMPDPPAPSLA